MAMFIELKPAAVCMDLVQSQGLLVTALQDKTVKVCIPCALRGILLVLLTNFLFFFHVLLSVLGSQANNFLGADSCTAKYT